MANRVLRDTTDSEKINQLSAQAERFLYRLFMKADDFGCFHADTRLLKAHLFPLLLDQIREADISRWIAECEKAGLIALYKSSGKQYLEIIGFGQRLRQMKRRFPKPDSDPPPIDSDLLPIDGPETRNETKLETETRNENETAHSLESFKKAIGEAYIETMEMNHKGKDVEAAISQAHGHYLADPSKYVSDGDLKKLLNTWLANTTVKQLKKPSFNLSEI